MLSEVWGPTTVPWVREYVVGRYAGGDGGEEGFAYHVADFGGAAGEGEEYGFAAALGEFVGCGAGCALGDRVCGCEDRESKDKDSVGVHYISGL